MKMSKKSKLQGGNRLGKEWFSENALTVLRSRYLIKDAEGNASETPEDLFRRVARVVASAESRFDPQMTDEALKGWEEQFYQLMMQRRFLPNSPTLMNAGRSMGMLSACFVLPVPDSIDGIFSSIKHTALIQKAGGGTGFDFSRLRPAGDLVESSGGHTSGPLSFLRVFSAATDAIQQGAFRRGANMGIMRIDHPDIIEFIHVKEDLNALTNYNLSVSIPDAFMRDVREQPGKVHQVVNPRNGKALPLPRKDKPGEFWTVGEIFDLIVRKAWQTGEPGVVFIDKINAANPTPHVGRIEATNPCGEQPLLPYEACNLGSINLAEFITQHDGRAAMDWNALRDCVRLSARYLDNVVEVNNYPLEEIRQLCLGNRKIGLGVMGFADALYKLGIAYNSNDAVEWGGQAMKFINDESHNYSEELAEERGVFPNWQGSVWQTVHKRKMRNATTTTVAPTGTISIIAGCSGGVEPLFSPAFFRNVLGGKRLAEVNEIFKNRLVELGLYTDELINRVAQEGTVRHAQELPEELRRVFVCAHDITPEWHVKMQAAFQKHCDAAISKTINFAHDAREADVRATYLTAFDLNCKGVTVYRDGCRAEQPMALAGGGRKDALREIEPVKLPEIMSCIRVRQATPFGNMHVKISVDPKANRELEVFAQLGKGGDVANSDLEAVCRLTSLFLRSGGSLKRVLDQLEGIGSSMVLPTRNGKIRSLADGVAHALRKYLRAKELFGLRALLLGEIDMDALATDENSVPAITAKKDRAEQELVVYKIKCPDCGGALAFEEGCAKCGGCGYSQC